MSNHKLKVLGIRKRPKSFKGEKNKEYFTENELGKVFNKKGDLIVKGTMTFSYDQKLMGEITSNIRHNNSDFSTTGYNQTEIFMESGFTSNFVEDAVDGVLNAVTVETAINPKYSVKVIDLTAYFIIIQRAQRLFLEYYNTKEELLYALKNGYYKEYELFKEL